MKPLNDVQIAYIRDNMTISEGSVVWKTDAPRRKAGEFCGWVDDAGYQRIQLSKGVFRRGHQIAYFLSTGEWPAVKVDHIDGNRSNNAIENLRLVDDYGNARNSVSQMNSCGFQGVSRTASGKYKAEIMSSRKRRHLGSFNTPEEAFCAYKTASIELHGEHSPFYSGRLAA